MTGALLSSRQADTQSQTSIDKPLVSGSCDPAFAEVRQEFERNFRDRGEIGAAVSVCIEGRPVVDLWGGLADQETNRPWEQDTLVVVFSSTKGLASLCMHMLADRKVLDWSEPVASYWPEFRANGKEDVTVAMVMSHQAGLPYWEEAMPRCGILDWALSTSMLAAQAPAWEPGTAHGYHAVTLGHLQGEILRRACGRTIGRFFREEVAGPLSADAWIGLPEEEDGRAATVYLAEPDMSSAMFRKLMAEPDWSAWKMITNDGGDGGAGSVNSRERRAAEIPATGGMTNARGLAKIYAPLALDGSVGGTRIVSASALPAMRTVCSASGCDIMLRLPTTFTLGFSKSWGSRRLGDGNHVSIGEQAFGTPGLGGNMGFADPEARMSFGYTMNRHGGGTGLNQRGQSLIDAAYRAVGFTSCEQGFWIR